MGSGQGPHDHQRQHRDAMVMLTGIPTGGHSGGGAEDVAGISAGSGHARPHGDPQRRWSPDLHQSQHRRRQSDAAG